MNHFERAEAIEDLYQCHDKRDLAKMVVKLEGDIQEMVAKAAANKLDGYRELSERACKAEEELASCQRMYTNACATLGEIQGYLGNDIVGIEPELVKQLIEERNALAAHVARLQEVGESLRESWDLNTILGAEKRRSVEDWDKARKEAAATSLARVKDKAQADFIDGLLKNHTEFAHPEAGPIVELMVRLEAGLRQQAKELKQ